VSIEPRQAAATLALYHEAANAPLLDRWWRNRDSVGVNDHGANEMRCTNCLDRAFAVARAHTTEQNAKHDTVRILCHRRGGRAFTDGRERDDHALAAVATCSDICQKITELIQRYLGAVGDQNGRADVAHASARQHDGQRQRKVCRRALASRDQGKRPPRHAIESEPKPLPIWIRPGLNLAPLSERGRLARAQAARGWLMLVRQTALRDNHRREKARSLRSPRPRPAESLPLARTRPQIASEGGSDCSNDRFAATSGLSCAA
jgi:hypothetical protein